MESQACYQVFLCKERRWKGKGESLSFSPYGEKKPNKQENLFSVIIYDQQYHQLNNTLVWQPFLNWNHPRPSRCSSKLHSQSAWLKMLHAWQMDCPFLKIPTVNRPGASPRVLAQMHLTIGRKQTGTANFMGQLWREANKYVERSKKKICLASSHGAVMFHEIHILC